MRIHKGHAKRVFNWCKAKYGRSKYANYPSYSFKKFTDYDELDLDGYYEPIENCIYINSDIKNTGDIKYLISTIIEEYVHYTQSDAQYQRLADQYDYYDHPFEIHAKLVADRDCNKCLKELKMFFGDFF